jgi:uncharacterized lipoprotein
LKTSLTPVLVLCIAVPTMLVTAGCNPFRRHSADSELCKVPEVYAEAKEAKSLTIPAGLEAPDTRNALRIPDLSTPEPPPRTKGQGCLDEPPSYVLPKPKEPAT